MAGLEMRLAQIFLILSVIPFSLFTDIQIWRVCIRLGLKQGMWISLVLAGHSGSRDLTLGCSIWNICGKDLLSWGDIWIEGGFIRALFQRWDRGVKYCWNRCSSNFSFRNKFIIVLPCGLLVDNNTFSKIWVFKSRTGYTVDGGYGNRNAYILIIIIIIIKSKAVQNLGWLF